MSSKENDLTQSLLAECRRKDELLEAYKEKIQILEKLLKLKDQRIKIADDRAEDLKELLRESLAQTDRAIGITNNIIK
jgi:hypothetical protein